MGQDMDKKEELQAAMERQFKECGTIFIALGDETRQQILMALFTAERAGMRVPEITKRTNLSRPAVSHHLKVLKDAGLVSMNRIGTMNYYFAEADKGRWDVLKSLVDNVHYVIEKNALEKKEDFWS